MESEHFSRLFSDILPNEAIQLIRRDSKIAEKAGKLSPDIIQLIYQNKWLKVMVPASCKGLEWQLPQVVKLFEALAYADGNVGWCVNLGAGANLFSGYFQQTTAEAIFSPANTWCAGSGARSGTARKVAGGFIVTGKWKYASGSLHATHFTVNALLLDEQGGQIIEEDQAAFRSFICPAESVKILNTWQVSGLKASSSNDFGINEAFVPDTHCFSLTHPSEFAQAPVFHFPFDKMAIVNMAVMMTGMGLHFLELFQDLMNLKTPVYSNEKLGAQKIVQETYEQCYHEVLNARINMYQSLGQCWAYYLKGETASSPALDELSAQSKKAAESVRKTLYKLFPLCGMSIIFSNSELNKVWRDLSVAGQHYLLSPANQF